MLPMSSSFASYKFRSYFVQRKQHAFRDLDGSKEQSPEHLRAFYNEKKEIEVLKRTAVINLLYDEL
jgi:hypothetical protein